MKKLLYIAPVIIDLEKLNGVSKKILNHYKIFQNNYDAEVISYGPDCLYHFSKGQVERIPLDQLNRRLKLYSYIREELVGRKYDLVYIRHHLADMLFVYLLRLIKKSGSKIVIEIPTFPYRHELLKWKNGLIRYLVDSSSTPFLKLFVDRIVTYSGHKRIFGIKTINTINGIIFDNVSPVNKSIHSDTKINLISVSVTMACHGYDRVIEGLKNYYLQGGSIKIVYHLVGDGEEIEKYKDLVANYQLEDHVIIYGFKGGDELNKIYDMADLAVNSLAIHRIGLSTESTIKSKEYAAKGLPIISSYSIDALSDTDNAKYVLKVPADESPIDIDQVIAFHNKIYHKYSNNVADQIRSASQARCDMIYTLQGVIEYFNSSIAVEKI